MTSSCPPHASKKKKIVVVYNSCSLWCRCEPTLCCNDFWYSLPSSYEQLSTRVSSCAHSLCPFLTNNSPPEFLPVPNSLSYASGTPRPPPIASLLQRNRSPVLPALIQLEPSPRYSSPPESLAVSTFYVPALLQFEPSSPGTALPPVLPALLQLEPSSPGTALHRSPLLCLPSMSTAT